ncbi:MAG: ATPase, T2SS/T4P/T4SS family [bacterium]
MKKITNVSSEYTSSEAYAKAVELASLVGDILIDTNQTTYRKKLKQSNPSKELLHTFSLIRKNTSLPAETMPLEKISLEDMLAASLSSSELEKIQELATDPEVMEIYTKEYTQRKDTFDLLARGQKELPKVLSQEKIVQQAKQKILDMRIQAFREHKSLTPVQIAYIHKVQEMIDQKLQDIQDMLNKRELATAYRLHQLQTYKKQLDTTGFMITPSRQENIDEIIEKILLGQNVLLTGPTGTGKTVLALQAVRTIA